MERIILEKINRIKASENLLTLKEILIEVKKALDFTNVLYAIQTPCTFTKIRTFIISDFPEEWMNKYEKMEYIKVDPIVKHCSKSYEPICWDRCNESDNQDAIKLTEELAKFNLLGGISVGMPNHHSGTSIFSLAANHVVTTGSIESLTASLFLNSLHPYLNDAIIKLSTDKQIKSRKPKLTEREMECLNWTVAGKTSREMADILSISEATVVFHMKNVIIKLNVKNRSQAIAQAILFGIVSPDHSSTSTSPTYHF